MKRTLDEAIKQYQTLARRWNDKAKVLSEFNKDRTIDPCDTYLQSENDAIRKARECEELVEWLTELKKYKSKKPSSKHSCYNWDTEHGARCVFGEKHCPDSYDCPYFDKRERR